MEGNHNYLNGDEAQFGNVDIDDVSVGTCYGYLFNLSKKMSEERNIKRNNNISVYVRKNE